MCMCENEKNSLYLKGYGYSQLIFFHKTYHSKHADEKARNYFLNI